MFWKDWISVAMIETEPIYDVISNPGNGKVKRGVQTYDSFIRQQVTAYLNVLFVPGFPLTIDEIFSTDEGTLAYYNHGDGVLDCVVSE